MMSAASQFLDELECSIISGRNVPMPHVMRRIFHLLAALYPSDIPTAAVPTTTQTNKTACPISHPTAAVTTTTRTDNTDVHADSYVQHTIREFRKCVSTLKSSSCPLYVDIQYLESKKGFIIKEFSAECLGCPNAWITVKSPLDDSPRPMSNEHTVTHINGLDWDCGMISIDQLKEYTAELFENGERRVFVKGMRKMDLLIEKLNIPQESITELWFCPKLILLRRRHVITNPCPYHRNLNPYLACAEKNTHALVRSGITDVLLKQWFKTTLRRCDTCRKTAHCVKQCSDFDGDFFDVCCKCRRTHQRDWRRRNNPYELCDHLPRERSEEDTKTSRVRAEHPYRRPGEDYGRRSDRTRRS